VLSGAFGCLHVLVVAGHSRLFRNPFQVPEGDLVAFVVIDHLENGLRSHLSGTIQNLHLQEPKGSGAKPRATNVKSQALRSPLCSYHYGELRLAAEEETFIPLWRGGFALGGASG
jgi:hypothetical protein